MVQAQPDNSDVAVVGPLIAFILVIIFYLLSETKFYIFKLVQRI